MTQRKHLVRAGLMGCLVILVLVSGCFGSSKRKEPNVHIVYTPKPDRPEILDSGSDPIRVCVGDIDVKWSVHEKSENDIYGHMVGSWSYDDGSGQVKTVNWSFSGGTAEQDAQHASQIWSREIRNQIAALLMEQAGVAGENIQLVERDRLPDMLDEDELKTAGIVDDEGVVTAKRLPVDVFIYGEIDGRTLYVIDVKKGKSLPGIPGMHGIDTVGRYLLSRPSKEIRQTIEFAGNLRVVDHRSGEQCLTQAVSGQYVDEKKSHIIKGDPSVMDFVPPEQLIRDIFQDEARLFVGRMLPTPVTKHVYVKASSNDDSKEGLKLLKDLNSPQRALPCFERAIQADPEDHNSYFGAGVCCEVLQFLDKAAEYYDLAVRNCDSDKLRPGKYGEEYARSHGRVQKRLEAGEPGVPPTAKTEFAGHEEPRSESGSGTQAGTVSMPSESGQ